MFQVPSTAFVIIGCCSILAGVVTTLSTTVIEKLVYEMPEVKAMNDVLKPLFLILFPQYCLGRGVVDMSIYYNTAQSKIVLGANVTYSPFDFDLIGKNLLALFIHGIFYFILTLLIQYKFFIRRCKNTNNDVKKIIENNSKNEDDDVYNERIRILNLNAQRKAFRKKTNNNKTDKDFIKLINLSKVYTRLKKFKLKKHVAVKSLCLGIDKGECFGLIG